MYNCSQVLDHCDDIPVFTPISMFIGDVFVGASGLFMKCTPDGSIQVRIQGLFYYYCFVIWGLTWL